MILQHRYFAGFTKAKLERARCLYVRLCRGAIAKDRSGDKIIHCAKQMLISGMYASTTPLSQIRYSILRRMWRLDSASRMRWHEWTERNGWRAHSWTRKPIEQSNWHLSQIPTFWDGRPRINL